MWKPGEIAPRSGEFQLYDADGTPTGNYVSVEKGNRFPPADQSGQYYE